MNTSAVIIPVLNPTFSLVDYVKSLIDQGTPQIIVVNDGSKAELTPIFTELAAIEGCTVLTHTKNKGKGRALKTAFSYFLEHFSYLSGVITADADGQHSVEDVYKVAEVLERNTEGFILGVRKFDKTNVPKRSIIGNKFTSFIFRVLYGAKISDTQTGLRGIPIKELPALVKLKGERYEYEMNMLILARKKQITMHEVPIETLYFDNNKSSHYHAIFDSTRIFFRLISGFIEYCFSTITSGIIDIISFIILNSFVLEALPFGERVLYASFIARAISSTYNFYINRRVVFNSTSTIVKSITKYYILCLAIILASYLLVTLSHIVIGINVVFIKICFDLILGICSYQVQLHWVFRKEKQVVMRGSESSSETFKG